MFALKTSCENFDNPVFPNAMIAGDIVITHLLHRLGYLESGKCKVMVVDTFHLFLIRRSRSSTRSKEYNFEAEIFGPTASPSPTPRTAPTSSLTPRRREPLEGGHRAVRQSL